MKYIKGKRKTEAHNNNNNKYIYYMMSYSVRCHRNSVTLFFSSHTFPQTSSSVEMNLKSLYRYPSQDASEDLHVWHLHVVACGKTYSSVPGRTPSSQSFNTNSVSIWPACMHTGWCERLYGNRQSDTCRIKCKLVITRVWYYKQIK